MGYGWRGGRGGRGFGQGPGSFVGPNLPPLPPPPPGHMRIAIATMDGRGLASVVAPRLARAPFITIIDVFQGKVVSIKPIQNPFAQAPRGAGVGLGQWLLSSQVAVLIGPHVGPNLSMVLRQGGIRVELVPPGTPVAVALRNIGIAV